MHLSCTLEGNASSLCFGITIHDGYVVPIQILYIFHTNVIIIIIIIYMYIYICKRLNVYSFGKPRETKRLCSIALLVITKEYPACFPIFSDTIQLQMPIPERCHSSHLTVDRTPHSSDDHRVFAHVHQTMGKSSRRTRNCLPHSPHGRKTKYNRLSQQINSSNNTARDLDVSSPIGLNVIFQKKNTDDHHTL